eukprot:329307-Amphidinium_carterae.1
MLKNIHPHMPDLVALGSSFPPEMLSRLWPAMSEEAGVGEMPVPDTSSLETVLPLVAISMRRKMPAASIKMLAAKSKELEAKHEELYTRQKELEAKTKELLAKSTKQEAMLAAKTGELERAWIENRQDRERELEARSAEKKVQLEGFKRTVSNWSRDLCSYIRPRREHATLAQDAADWLQMRAMNMSL